MQILTAPHPESSHRWACLFIHVFTQQTPPQPLSRTWHCMKPYKMENNGTTSPLSRNPQSSGGKRTLHSYLRCSSVHTCPDVPVSPGFLYGLSTRKWIKWCQTSSLCLLATVRTHVLERSVCYLKVPELLGGVFCIREVGV